MKLVLFLISCSLFCTAYADEEGNAYCKDKTQGWYAKEETQCKSYYSCAKLPSGTVIGALYNCPGDFLFNAEPAGGGDPLCDYEENVECVSGSAGKLCIGQASGDYPVPKSGCKKYYTCKVNGIETIGEEKTCDAGLLFNEDTAKCEAEDSFDCVSGTAGKICADLTPPDEHHVVPGGGCKQYYSCDVIDGETIGEVEDCEEGLFNDETKECDVDPDFKCFSGAAGKDCIGEDDGDYVKGGSICTKYYTCKTVDDETMGELKECEAGLFNDETKECDVDPDFKCFSGTAGKDCIEKDDGNHVVVGSDCKEYITCEKVDDEYTGEKKECEGDLVFDGTECIDDDDFECEE